MRRTLVAIAALALGACAPSSAPITPDHPANPDAPIGRLAGPPAALRPGVVSLTEPTTPDAARATGHEHHDMSPPDSTPANPAPPANAEPTKSKPPEPTTPKTTPKPKRSEPKPTPKKSPAPKPTPAPDPHQGHDMGHR